MDVLVTIQAMAALWYSASVICIQDFCIQTAVFFFFAV